MIFTTWIILLGNTICDSYFNNELCDWDGGDCCTQFTDLDKCGPGDHCTCHLTGRLHKTLKSGNTLANSILQHCKCLLANNRWTNV